MSTNINNTGEKTHYAASDALIAQQLAAAAAGNGDTPAGKPGKKRKLSGQGSQAAEQGDLKKLKQHHEAQHDLAAELQSFEQMLKNLPKTDPDSLRWLSDCGRKQEYVGREKCEAALSLPMKNGSVITNRKFLPNGDFSVIIKGTIRKTEDTRRTSSSRSRRRTKCGSIRTTVP